MKKLTSIGLLLLLLMGVSNIHAQSCEDLVAKYLAEHKEELKLTDKDVQNWVIYDKHTSKKSGVEHVYIRQHHEGIELFNAVANFAIKNGLVFHTGNRFVANVSEKVNTKIANISPFEAIISASTHLGLEIPTKLKIIETVDTKHFLIDGSEISLEDIPVQLLYLPTENDIKLVWDLSIYLHSKEHWWSIRVDAQTGEVLDKTDWVVSCTFESCDHSELSHSSRRPIPEVNSTVASPVPPPSTDQYRVYGLPLESPNHGPRNLEVGPSDPIASPYGWHDDDGIPGAEYTVTQGNNVRATEDINNNGGVGFMPDGGTSLNFDFPVNFNNSPASNQAAAITNLFYWNNIMHDVYYQYGFDESSGNFQENNYGNGGNASDNVNAEGLDGGGTNNANFATPGDGSNPRMQMFLWTGANQYYLTVNSPSAIAGQYSASIADFGPTISTTPISANFSLVNDGTSLPNEGCSQILNSSVVAGKIAVVYRGNCSFVQKVQYAQNAGAIAVIVINNVSGLPATMGGTSSTITIPSIMISNVDGALIAGQLSGGVNGTIQSPASVQPIDGDFDNGIIAHEYGHGISNRLTGGPSASSCLSNAEQMGEGWSDWFGLMLTTESGDLGTDGRGIGTYAKGQTTTGPGIRPTQYSTDMLINPSTYATTNNTANITQPHGIGYVWCTMLWDLNWALVDRYGFDNDVYSGTGGNNIAMSLVIEALKLQPCSPGFVDGRNAILAADMLLYNGANQCLIWNVFANRGLGFSASQGSTNSRTDQIEAFDLPTISCNAKLDITAFIEGYYNPSSNPPAMVPAYHNNDLFATGGTASLSTDVDSINVELYAPSDLYTPAYTQTKMLSTNGLLSCSFPDSAVGESYYIVLKSKNTLETWSANPVLMTEATSYNFSNSMAKAYTDNSSDPMATLTTGLYGIYTADLNQDDFIDAFDYPIFTSDQILSSGLSIFFLPGDMNGDGFVDAFDYPVFSGNSVSGVTIQRP